MLDNAAGAAVQKEGYGNVTGVCLIHMQDQMRQKRIFITLNRAAVAGAVSIIRLVPSFAFVGMTCLTPPRGSSTSPEYRGIT